MKIFVKTSILLLVASAFFFSNLSAEVNDLSSGAEVSTQEFYFPAFDSNMESFWADFGLLYHKCSASSWLGHRVTASCREDEVCTCRSNLFYASCDCNNPD